MASQPVMEAAARESRANAREDMAILTSGAREKVDAAMASMQALGKKMLHPTDKVKKEEAHATAEQQKKEAREKRDEIRSIAAAQAASERAAARGMVAKGAAEAGGTRYPVLTMGDQPQQETLAQEALDPNYQPQQQTTLAPQTLNPNHHNHPPVMDPNFQAQQQPTSTLQTLDPVMDPNFQPQQQPTSTTQTLDPNFHRHNQAPVMDTPVEAQSFQNTFQDTTRTDASVPLDTIRVETPHDQRPVVGGGAADTSTEAPVPVPPPSRQDRSGERVHGGEKDVEGVEDADYYPPTRIVQT